MDNNPMSPMQPVGASVVGSPPRLGTPVPGTTGGLPALAGLSVLQNPMAQQLQSMGRGQDKMLVHMTPEEVGGLQQLAMASGGSLTINPHTGFPEAGWLSKLLPTLAGVALSFTPAAPFAPLIVGGGFGLAKGSLKEGLMAGLQAYGGASLASGLSGAVGAAKSGLPLVGSVTPATTTSIAHSAANSIGAGSGLPLVGSVTPATTTSIAHSAANSIGAGSGAAADIAAQGAKTGIPGFMSRFSEAARTGIAPGLKVAGLEGTKAGAALSKYAPMAATMGLTSAVSNATQPNMPTYKPEETKSTYGGPYVPLDRKLTMPTAEDRQRVGTGEFNYFTPNSLDLSSAYTLNPEERRRYGFAEGGSTDTATSAPDYSAYVNAYPDLISYYNARPTDYGDVNNDGTINITDFGLGHWGKYGQQEGRALTGPVPAPATNNTGIYVDPSLTNTSLTQPAPTTSAPAQQVFGGQSPFTGDFGKLVDFYAASSPRAVTPSPASLWNVPTTGESGFFGNKGKTTGGTSGTGGTGTTGTTTKTNTTTPISDAERAKWAAYVNAYPDLAAAFQSNNAAFQDFNKDGKIDIADFGLGHYTNYGQKENRSLTGPAAMDTTTGATTGAAKPISAEDLAKVQSLFTSFQDTSSPVYGSTDYARLLIDQYRSGDLDPESGTAKAMQAAGFNRGGGVHMGNGAFVLDARTVSEIGNGSSNAGKELLARMGGRPLNGPGDGVSDSIPANIGGHQKARVARDEVIMPPEVVKRLGKGNPKRGADKLYNLMDRAHTARKQAKRGQDTGLRKGLA